MAAIDDSVTIDIDTGGTFTDGVVSSNGQTWPVKVLTTPHDLTIALRDLIAEASAQLDVDPDDLLRRVAAIRYSTTLGTNTVIERNGPRIGVLLPADAGPLDEWFRPGTLIGDVLDPLEAHVRGVGLTGDEALDAEPVLSAVEALLDAGAERLAVVVPDAEGRAEAEIQRIVLGEYPRHILGALPVVFSSQLTADTDLKRRITTAVLNSYLHPQLEHFLYEAENVLRDRGLNRPLFVFCNDGTTNRVAKVTAIKTHNSGPAGGVQATAALADQYSLSHLATIDIGGTSTDVAFVIDGAIEEMRHGAIEDAELSLPMRCIDALGGGGGTIAEVRDGELALGPRSAGAAPGPACFGFGGTDATVTDANLVLGLFEDGQRLAGRVPLDAARARASVLRHLAEPLGVGVEHAAVQVRQTLERRIGEHLREGMMSRASGADWVLVAYGGAGPVHAARIAEHAGIDRVLVPGLASVCSAMGLGFADVEHRYGRVLPRGDAELAGRIEQELRDRAAIDMRGEGFSLDDVSISIAREPLADGEEELALTASAPLPKAAFAAQERPSELPPPVGSRAVWWSEAEATDTPIFAARELEQAHTRVPGPAIVAGDISTVCVPRGWTLERDVYDQYFLTREA
jgi:N-methylhydantoinase A/oxoprolinase/acetone carboxylase beta subunit